MKKPTKKPTKKSNNPYIDDIPVKKPRKTTASKIVYEEIPHASTKVSFVSEPDEQVIIPPEVTKPPIGVVRANVFIFALVGLGVLVWNYKHNWPKPEVVPNLTPVVVSKPTPIMQDLTPAPTTTIVVTPPVSNPVNVIPSAPVNVVPEEKEDQKKSELKPRILGEALPVNQALLLPNKTLTPGKIDPLATKEIICKVGFSTKARLIGQTNKLKVFQLYNIDWKKDKYEVDHLVALELGGANEISNLWPQSYTTQPWNAHKKDRLENKLHKMVCSGEIELAEAQKTIIDDWVSAYTKYVKE